MKIKNIFNNYITSIGIIIFIDTLLFFPTAGLMIVAEKFTGILGITSILLFTLFVFAVCFLMGRIFLLQESNDVSYLVSFLFLALSLIVFAKIDNVVMFFTYPFIPAVCWMSNLYNIEQMYQMYAFYILSCISMYLGVITDIRNQ